MRVSKPAIHDSKDNRNKMSPIKIKCIGIFILQGKIINCFVLYLCTALLLNKQYACLTANTKNVLKAYADRTAGAFDLKLNNSQESSVRDFNKGFIYLFNLKDY